MSRLAEGSPYTVVEAEKVSSGSRGTGGQGAACRAVRPQVLSKGVTARSRVWPAAGLSLQLGTL